MDDEVKKAYSYLFNTEVFYDDYLIKIEYLNNNSNNNLLNIIIDKYINLPDKYNKYSNLILNIIVETIIIIKNDISIANLKYFDYNLIYNSNEKILIKLINNSNDILINTLYRALYLKNLEKVKFIINNLNYIDKDIIKVIFGLNRKKIGVDINEDLYISQYLNINFNILKYKEISVLKNYEFKFFIEDFLFDEKINSDQIYFLVKNLLSLKIKDENNKNLVKLGLFTLIENILNQVLFKMVFKKEENCSFVFIKNFTSVLFKISQGFFKESFVDKIGKNLLPSYLSFNLIKFIFLLKENKIPLENDLKEYLEFLLKVLFKNQSLIFKSTENKEKLDFETLLKKYTTSEIFTDLKNDEIFFRSVFDTLLNIKIKINFDKNFLINFFTYKNHYKESVLKIILRFNLSYDKVFYNTLINNYNDNSLYCKILINEIFILNRNIETDISFNYIRMINNMISETEKLFYDGTKILNLIKTYRNKLNEYFSNLNENIDLIKKNKLKELKIKKIEIDENDYGIKIEEIMKIEKNRKNVYFYQKIEKSKNLEFLHNTFYFYDLDLLCNERINALLEENNIKNKENPDFTSFLDICCALNSFYFTKVYKKTLKYSFFIEKDLKSIKSMDLALKEFIKALKSFLEKNKRLFLNRSVFYRLMNILQNIFSFINLQMNEKNKFNINLIKTDEKISFSNFSSYFSNHLIIKNLSTTENEKKIYFKKIFFLNDILKILIQFESHVKFIKINTSDLENILETVNKSNINEITLKKTIKMIKTIKENNNENEEIECPDEFLDPLTFNIMKTPVKLKTSKQTIDLSTFKEIMLNDQKDPFNRMELKDDDYEEDFSLKEKIESFLKNI